VRRFPLVVSVLAVALFGGPALVAPALAAAQDATPPAPAAIGAFEPLAAAYLPAEHLEGAVDAVAYTVRLRPGGRVDFPAGSRPDSATLEYVVAGTYAVRSEGPLVVLRGGATGPNISAEEVPPGQEATVAQGDAVLNLDSDAPATVRNPEDRETLVFGAGAFARAAPPPPATPTWDVAAVDASVGVVGAQELPDVEGPVSVLLARWVLEPGEALVPTTGPWPELVWTEAPFDTAGRSNPGAEPIEVLTASFGSAD
jgi:hypothetical protein